MKTTSPTVALTNYLVSFLDKTNSSHTQQIEEAVKAFKSVVLKKNEYLVQENQVCTQFCFLESGILQHAISVAGEEKTTYLALRNSVTSSLSSFLNQTPSRKSIKALADTNLWIVNLETFKDLITRNEAFSQFYHNLIEKQICLIDDYRIDLLTLTPEERYNKLLLTEPKLLQEVPLHYLASFLGISTRHMSRIRTNIK
jgi:CRP-like cAMP-binding protein